VDRGEGRVPLHKNSEPASEAINNLSGYEQVRVNVVMEFIGSTM